MKQAFGEDHSCIFLQKKKKKKKKNVSNDPCNSSLEILRDFLS